MFFLLIFVSVYYIYRIIYIRDRDEGEFVGFYNFVSPVIYAYHIMACSDLLPRTGLVSSQVLYL